MAPKVRLTRQESKAKTRGEILEAAARLFARDGFVATSLSAIAEEAGLTKGAVYSNFDSKEDLFLTIVRSQSAAVGAPKTAVTTDDWERALSNGGSPSAQLEQLGRDAHRQAPSARNIALFFEYNAFALRNRRSQDWVRKHNAEYFEGGGASLRRAEVADAAAEDLVAIAQSLYVGLMLHRAFEPDRFDEDLFAKAFRALSSVIDEV